MNRTIAIIGAGLAGLSAALCAAEHQCSVKLISSFPSERAQSVMAAGGINAALNTKGENDSPEQHYKDTIRAGAGLSDPGAVWNLTHAAPGLVLRLHEMGVQFNTDEFGTIDLRNFGGQKKKRTAFSQSDTGKQLMTALIDAVREKEAEGFVERFSHHTFETLLVKDNVCFGCVIRDSYSGKCISVPADAVIAASGGFGGLFQETTGSLANTGEVTAALLRLGVFMANLEMIQYHPTTVSAGGKRMLISEAARGEGGRLLAFKDGQPWYFMEEKYPEFGNLMTRDVTSREIWNVGRNSQVFLDMTGIPEDLIKRKLSSVAADCMLYLHKDIRKEMIPVEPGIHYFMGGIYVDERHRTSMRHLYAAGECCAQYHGANRLGGNSMLGALYGGKIAAENACKEEKSPQEKADETEWMKEAGYSGERRLLPDEKARLGRIMSGALGVVRNERDLQTAIEKVSQMSGDLPLLGRAVLESALARKESRGAHYREDYPEMNDALFRKTTVARYDSDQIRISFEALPERRAEV